MSQESAQESAQETARESTQVEVRRNGALFATVGLVCVVLATGYLIRAIGRGGVFPWLAFVVLAGLGTAMLVSWLESRSPLMVADEQGIRIRLGREWCGLPWAGLEQVVVEQRTSVLHDGRLVVVPAEESALDGLDPRARRQVAVTARLYGSELVVPLGMTTRVSVPHLVDTLAALAGTRTPIVELAAWAPEPVVPMDAAHLERREERAREAVAAGSGAVMGGHLVESRFERQARAFEGLGIFEDLAASVSGGVNRGVTSLVGVLEQRRERTEVRLAELEVVATDGATALQLEALPEEVERPALPEAGALRRGDQADLEDWAGDWAGDWADTDWDVARTPAPAPPEQERVLDVIGVRVREARVRLGHTVESLAERTRIQPSVISGIEADDFAPCGGDFYARGHLRTLAGAVGLPAEEIVASYDAHHASGPVNASRVFEADLTTTRDPERTGRRWAMVLGVVLTLVLAWGLARLFAQPQPEVRAPSITGSSVAADRAPVTSALGAMVPLRLTAARGPASVVVKDRAGQVVFQGRIPSGGSRQVIGTGPFQVTADLPANVDVAVDGKAAGTVGAGYSSATRTFGRR